MSCLSLFGETCKNRKVLLVWLQLTGSKEEILGEIAIVIGSMSSSLVLAMSDKKDVCARADQDLYTDVGARSRYTVAERCILHL